MRDAPFAADSCLVRTDCGALDTQRCRVCLVRQRRCYELAPMASLQTATSGLRIWVPRVGPELHFRSSSKAVTSTRSIEPLASPTESRTRDRERAIPCELES